MQAEIAVNRAFAPAIYRGVVPITREASGQLAIGGKGEPVEWAVEMRRFDESQTLDHLAASRSISTTLSPMHSGAPWRPRTAWRQRSRDAHFVEALAKIIAQNETELAAEPDLLSLQDLRALADATRDAFERVKPLLSARERAGLVRRCHGDLHLGNIVLIDGKPVLFDAIEFDDRIATGDVFYDLAFLLMDLIERGLHRAANIVLNRYLTDTQRIHDLDALAALPLFMSVRAAIRAKVTAARRRQGGSPAGAHTKRARLCRAGSKTSGAGQAAIDCHRRTCRAPANRCSHARWRRAFCRLPGAVMLAQRCRAQGDVRYRRNRTIAGEQPTPRRPRPRSMPRLREGQTRDCRRSFGHRGRCVRAARRAGVTSRKPLQRRVSGPIPHTPASKRVWPASAAARDDASDADANVARKQEEFDLGRMKWVEGRCLRHAGRNVHPRRGHAWQSG